MLEYLKTNRRKSCITILFILLETAMQTLSATILAWLLDTAADRNFSATLWLFFLNAVIFGAFLLFRYLSMRCRINAVQGMVKDYRENVTT